MIKNILICGYPKSGTTWLSRLVEELVQCPNRGNWGLEDPTQPLLENLDVQSEFVCYKSHHSLSELQNVWDKPVYKIIYIVRDPRDVVLSGAYYRYFNFHYPLPFFNNLPTSLTTLYKKCCNRLLSQRIKKKRMTKAVLFGDPNISDSLNRSWKEHYLDFKQPEVLAVKYEDLQQNPLTECKRIASFLRIDRDDTFLSKAISKQSFSARREKALKENDEREIRFLRKGESGYWKNELSENQLKAINTKLRIELLELGYLSE